MKKNTYGEKPINFLKEYWTMLGFGMSVIIYLFGYIKASYFLKKYNVLINPTDIYSNISLFVSGLTTITTGLIVPLINMTVGILLYYCLISTKINGKKMVFIGWIIGICYVVVFPFIIELLPGNLYVMPLINYLVGNEYPKLGVYSLAIITLAQIVCTTRVFIYRRNFQGFLLCNNFSGRKDSANYCLEFHSRKRKKTLREIFLISLIFLWFFIFMASQIATFPYLRTVQLGLVGLSGMRGVISTELPISIQSKKMYNSGKGYFDTHGFLINKTDSTYYFIPIGESNEWESNHLTSVSILPSTKVLGFYGDAS